MLNYKSFGQGEPLIILHGLFGTLDNWQTIAKRLANNYLVYIIDQRNHGKSPHHDEFSYEILADDLQEFMSENWIYKAHILGHSMGGKTAMQFAVNYPDMVDKLVVVDIGTQQYEGHHHDIFDALFSLDFDKIETRKQADETLVQKIEDFGVRQFLLKNLTRNKTGGYRWKMNLPVLHEKYEEILAEIESDTPYENETLFIRGGDSNYIRDEDWSDILDVFPNAQLSTVDGAGHWVHAVRPKELEKIVRDFLG